MEDNCDYEKGVFEKLSKLKSQVETNTSTEDTKRFIVEVLTNAAHTSIFHHKMQDSIKAEAEAFDKQSESMN